jgi:hypothetical protein
VVDQVLLLLGKNRMLMVQHRVDSRRAEVGLDVAIVVPGDGADTLAGLDAEIEQGAGEPADPLRVVRVGVAVVLAGRDPGDDLLVVEEPLGTPEQTAQQQGLIHRQGVHAGLRATWVLTVDLILYII